MAKGNGQDRRLARLILHMSKGGIDELVCKFRKLYLEFAEHANEAADRLEQATKVLETVAVLAKASNPFKELVTRALVIERATADAASVAPHTAQDDAVAEDVSPPIVTSGAKPRGTGDDAGDIERGGADTPGRTDTTG